MSHPTRVIEVQATEEKFVQMLKDAFGDRGYDSEGGTIRLEGDKPVEISFHEQPERHIGSLDLPMEKVRFEFPDQSEEEADAFMETYREHTMRTGG